MSQAGKRRRQAGSRAEHLGEWVPIVKSEVKTQPLELVRRGLGLWKDRIITSKTKEAGSFLSHPLDQRLLPLNATPSPPRVPSDSTERMAFQLEGQGRSRLPLVSVCLSFHYGTHLNNPGLSESHHWGVQADG